MSKKHEFELLLSKAVELYFLTASQNENIDKVNNIEKNIYEKD